MKAFSKTHQKLIKNKLSAQGHLKNQSSSIWLGAEEDFVHRILCQLVLVPLELNLLRIQSHKVAIVLWQLHPHVAPLPVKRIPLQVVDAPPVVGVFFSSGNLVFRSLELVCAICCAGVSHNWVDVHVS